MSVVRKITERFSSTAGSFFLASVASGMALALCAATMPDGASTSAQADAIAVPPLVRAEPATLPLSSPTPAVVEVAPTVLTKPVAAPAPASNHGARVRQLQKALARAGCYNGPISGIWSDASKDAMRGFATAANAQLPVDSPDDALVALVESNDTTACVHGRAIATGTLAPGNHQTAEQRTMLDQPWARAEMLTVPKEEAPAATPPPPEKIATHSESDKVIAPSSAPIAPALAASASDPAEPPVTPAKPKKAKTAKRKPSVYDDVETSISKGFDNLQRSLSSMF